MIYIGIDEVGRGPLAGPVVVCGFVSFIPEQEILTLFPKGTLHDSKKLTEKWRNTISDSLHILEKENKVSFALAEKSAKHIDTYGISLSIRECVDEIAEKILTKHTCAKNDAFLLLDGNLYADKSFLYQETIIKGDEKVIEIACASIIAKVYRDTYMKECGRKFPVYLFEKHMGYGTVLHRDLTRIHGACKEHRRTFLTKILS